MEPGDLIAVSFEVIQVLEGVSYDAYKSDSSAIEAIFLTTVATVLELYNSDGSPDTSGLTIISVSPVSATSRTAQLHLQTSGLQFDYKVRIVVGEGNDYTSADQAYKSSTSDLDESIADNSFTESLRESGNSALADATANEMPNISEPEQEVIPPVASSTIQDLLDGGTIAGITVGVFIFVLIGGFLYYRIHKNATFVKNLKLFRFEAAHFGNINFDDNINPVHASPEGGGGHTSFAAGVGAGAGTTGAGNNNDGL